MAGLIACVENDLKKTVAMSTLSQLGMILYILSIGELKLCYYHMLCHALFKSLLFLRCGLIIIMRLGEQDARFIGRLSIMAPSITLMIRISSIRLFGFIFFAGFYSKDSIIESIMGMEEFLLLVAIIIFSCVLTVIYRVRIIRMRLILIKIGFNYLVLFEGLKKLSIIIFLSL
jgi:NADH-ubiquinone oxidoreductase chain 5